MLDHSGVTIEVSRKYTKSTADRLKYSLPPSTAMAPQEQGT